jgi:hypothetical protein
MTTARVPALSTLVTGPSAQAREAAIAAALDAAPGKTAIILEGLAPGSSPLDSLSDHLDPARIAPGCLCCAGNLVLRVTLNRLLRQRPERCSSASPAANILISCDRGCNPSHTISC